MAYITGEKTEGCVLCDRENACREFILREKKHAYVMMNLYPYTTGHIMVSPIRHVGRLEDLSPEEKRDIFDLVVSSVAALKAAIKPDGLNVGMNLGHAAGAGVEDHLHVHIVPRWNGDTNFMSVVGEVRVIPEDVSRTWEKLKPYFQTADREE
jgi:ATP adenylyltransferase